MTNAPLLEIVYQLFGLKAQQDKWQCFSLLKSPAPPDNKVIVDDDSVPDVSLDARHLITSVPGVDVVGAGVGACCVEIHRQDIEGHGEEPSNSHCLWEYGREVVYEAFANILEGSKIGRKETTFLKSDQQRGSRLMYNTFS